MMRAAQIAWFRGLDALQDTAEAQISSSPTWSLAPKPEDLAQSMGTGPASALQDGVAIRLRLSSVVF